MTTSGMGAVTPTDVKNIVEELNKNLGLPVTDGNKPIVKTSEEIVRTGTLPAQAVAYQPVVNLSPEEKFYESLGLKSSMFFTLKSKGRLLVAVVLVGGYFAYKKFKK